MTREELINAINANEDAWSCPEYSCDMPELEYNPRECCLKCAEKQLKAYEDKIRADAIEEFNDKVNYLKKCYVDACNMCTKMECDVCAVNNFIEVLEQLKGGA